MLCRPATTLRAVAAFAHQHMVTHRASVDQGSRTTLRAGAQDQQNKDDCDSSRESEPRDYVSSWVINSAHRSTWPAHGSGGWASQCLRASTTRPLTPKSRMDTGGHHGMDNGRGNQPLLSSPQGQASTSMPPPPLRPDS